MVDTKRLEEVTTLHDLGHTLQACKAMEIDVENAYFAGRGGLFDSIVAEAAAEINTRQQDVVYVVIKIAKE